MLLYISHIESYSGRAQAREAAKRGWDVSCSLEDPIEGARRADVCILNLEEDVEGLTKLVDVLRTLHLSGLSRLRAVIGVSSLLSWAGSAEKTVDEDRYRRRIPMEGFEKLKKLEDLVLSLNGAVIPLPLGATMEQREAAADRKRIIGSVLATGVLFGDGEDVLAPLFQVCWEAAGLDTETRELNERIQAAVCGAFGGNRFLTLHVRDHARILMFLIDKLVDEMEAAAMPRYLIATAPEDETGCFSSGLSLTVKAIANAFGGDLNFGFLSRKVEFDMPQFGPEAPRFHMNLAVNVQSNYLIKLASVPGFELEAPRGLVEAAVQAVASYIEKRGLEPPCRFVIRRKDKEELELKEEEQDDKAKKKAKKKKKDEPPEEEENKETEAEKFRNCIVEVLSAVHRAPEIAVEGFVKYLKPLPEDPDKPAETEEGADDEIEDTEADKEALVEWQEPIEEAEEEVGESEEVDPEEKERAKIEAMKVFIRNNLPSGVVWLLDAEKDPSETVDEALEEKPETESEVLVEEPSLPVETTAPEAEQAKMFSAREVLSDVAREDTDEMKERAQKFSGYLTQMIMPHVTQGMLEMVRANPADPVEFLENYLRAAADRVEKQAEAAAYLQFQSALARIKLDQERTDRESASDRSSDFDDEGFEYEDAIAAQL